MSDLLRECGRCHDLWPLNAVNCGTCNSLLVLTVPDRVLARHVGSKRPHE